MADLRAVYVARWMNPLCLGRFGYLLGALEQEIPKDFPVLAGSWANLSTHFKFPQKVRRLIDTANTIEGFSRMLRKVTKAKSVFPTDDSLLKTLYLAMIDITKKWTGRHQDWSAIYAQMAIFFGDQIPK